MSGTEPFTREVDDGGCSLSTTSAGGPPVAPLHSKVTKGMACTFKIREVSAI